MLAPTITTSYVSPCAMVTLYKFAPALGLPDVSPFVVKLETYLKMAKIPYEGRPGDPRKAPKRKLPYIEHEGTTVSDSSFAIEHLKGAFGDSLDARLDMRQRALGTAFKSMLEEHLYFVVVYQRWKLDEGWATYTPVMREILAKAGVPSIFRGLVLRQIRGDALKKLDGQGTGRHTPAEVERVGKTIIASVGEQLGDGPFFLGAEPSSFDATAYAFLASVMDPPFVSEVKDAANARPNLRAYVDRMKAAYWS
jgi:glutathione S-transferase